MPPETPSPIHPSAAARDAASSPLHVAWYVVLLVGFQLAALAFSFWAALQPWFFDHANAPMLGVMGYGPELRGRNCDIVFYGDSTALSDFVPSLMEKKTGLTACNVAELRSTGECVGIDLPLDEYLKHNQRPRFLIAGFTPDNLNVGHERLRRMSPEDIAYALRYAPGAWLWKGMLQHPEPTLRFMAWAESGLINGGLRRMAAELHLVATPDASDVQRAERSAQGGMWAAKYPPQQHCSQEPLGLPWSHEQAAKGLTAFRQKYGVEGTRVLVYATPIAGCDAYLSLQQSRVPGLVDYPLQVLPVEDFNLRDVHLDLQAAQVFSAGVADDLLALMGKTSANGAAR